MCDSGYGKALVMGYYDGNTVTALWNYAQNFAMNDNSGTLRNLFDFQLVRPRTLILDPATGQPI